MLPDLSGLGVENKDDDDMTAGMSPQVAVLVVANVNRFRGDVGRPPISLSG